MLAFPPTPQPKSRLVRRTGTPTLIFRGPWERDGDRQENNRAGLGASRQLTDRFRIGGEGSGGNGGFGGRLSGDYRIDDRTSLYLAHTMETEREDSTYRGRFDNTVLGGRMKLSDQVSVYDEARSGRGAGPESLTNAFGVDLAPNSRWTYGMKFEAGTVSDPLAGDLERRAAALSAGYRHQQVRLNSSVEYRQEEGTAGERNTWLARNLASYQVSRDWRLLGKANFSFSSASRGQLLRRQFHRRGFRRGLPARRQRSLEHPDAVSLLLHIAFTGAGEHRR